MGVPTSSRSPGESARELARHAPSGLLPHPDTQLRGPGPSHDGIRAPLLAPVDASPHRHVLSGVVLELRAQRSRDGQVQTYGIFGNAVDCGHFERMEGGHAIAVRCT